MKMLTMYLNLTSIKILFIILQVNAESCKTPDDVHGECILLKSCPSLLKLITGRTPSSADFIRKSICGFDGLDSKVCCTNTSSDTNNSTDQDKKQSNSRHLLSDKSYCGYQHSDDYFHNDNSTVITEFPWLARLVYRDTDDSPDSYEKKYLCLGSLINSKYILTAASCLSRPELYILMEVQLGEYHTANRTDCVHEDSILEECSDPVKTYKVEKVISHAEFDTEPLVNDIGLIRLNSEVTYSDYIRPICLPYPGTKLAVLGDVLTTSGWGLAKNLGQTDKIDTKRRILTKLVSTEYCNEVYEGYLLVNDYYVCTTVADNKTDCIGDTGAPVTFSHRLQWHQEGITSFRSGKFCHVSADLHTRVEKYLDWIEEHIEP